MNKLNKMGNEMLEYKSELNNDYPEIVINSLLFAVDKLAEDGAIDVDIHYAIKENSITKENLRELLLSKSNFIKTYEELFYEYEEIRNKINNILKINDDNPNEEVKTLSSINNENISITKEFILTEKFIRDYFYIESEKDYEVLIKRKGFIEKFAILRLDKILKDFKEQYKIENKAYEVINSNVFFDADRNIYGIHLLFNIPINLLEDDDILNSIIYEINDIISTSKDYFNSKMSI